MEINLLLNTANRSWIIQKIAERLAEELRRQDMVVSITDQPAPRADVVHHMSWAFANIRTPQPSTMFITHLDDLFKLNQVKAMLASEVKVGICMSSDTMRQLAAHGCAEESLYYISPAHDAILKPRRIVIGITSRVYPDGRKREALLQQVAAQMDLSAFEFRIFGMGWEPTIQKLEAAGASVAYFAETDDYRKDYEILISAIPHFDHYLYLGMDEGSLGTLDALAAGVSTIVTPQGFHLDLPDGISHPIVDANDLKRVLGEISAPVRVRTAAVADLSWETYATRHLQVWQALVAGQPLPPLKAVQRQIPQEIEQRLHVLRERSVVSNAMSPRRVISAVSHWPLLRGVRRLVDQIRLGKR